MMTPQKLTKADRADLAKVTKAQAELDDLTARADKIRHRRDLVVADMLLRGVRPGTIIAESGARAGSVEKLSAAMSRIGAR